MTALEKEIQLAESLTYNDLSDKAKETYDLCVRLGDSHSQAMHCAVMTIKQENSAEFYRLAYES